MMDRDTGARALWRRRSLGEPLDLGALALIFVIAVAVRLAFIGLPMRFDEAYSFEHYAIFPAHGLTLAYDLPNNHIFNSLLMHFSFYGLGDAPWQLRLPVLLAGIAAVPAAYWAARELYGKAAGLWAAGLVATSSPMVDFSVNARGYELGALFVLLCLALGARAVRSASPWPVRGFVPAAALAVWSVPTMAYGMIAVALWMVGAVLLHRRPHWRAIARVATALGLGAALAYLLYWPITGQPGWNFVGPLPRTGPALRGLAHATWDTWNRTWPHPVDWLAAVAAVASIVLHRRIARHTMPLGVAGVLAVVVIVFHARIGPFPRSWIGLLPIYLVTAAGGLSALVDLLPRVRPFRRMPVATAGAVAAVVLSAILAVNVLRVGEDASEEPPQSDNDLAAIVKDVVPPGQLVLIDVVRFGAQLTYYLARAHYGWTGTVTPAQRQAGHVYTIVPRDQAGLAVAQVGGLGGRPTRRPPRLVRQLHYISIYDVSVHRR